MTGIIEFFKDPSSYVLLFFVALLIYLLFLPEIKKDLFIRFLEWFSSLKISHNPITYALFYIFCIAIPASYIKDLIKERPYLIVLFIIPYLPFHFFLLPKIKIYLKKVGLQRVTKEYLNKVKADREKERTEEREPGSNPKFIIPTLRLRKTGTEESSRHHTRNKPPEDGENWLNFRMQDFLSSDKRFTLVADSGMGKTTLLKELPYKIAVGEIKTELLPCYFELKELTDTSTKKKLIEHTENKFNGIYHPQLNEFINHLYDKGCFLFLFDALDQTTNQNNLKTWLSLLGNNHVIVAGRRWMYDRLDLGIGLSRDYQYVEISSFNNRQIKEYLGQDCYAVATSMVSRELLKVPLLLNHIKSLYQNGKLSQIKTRTELYDRIVDFLLNREISLGKRIPGVKTTKRRFEILSYHTISKGYLGGFPTTEVFPKLTRLLQISPDVDFPILTQLGIMYEIWEGDIEKKIDFRHQSFQEYFASFKLEKRIISDGKINNKELKKYLEHRRWDEVVLFLIGSLEPAVAKEIILFISCYDYYFGCKCIAHYKGNKGEDFKEIIDDLFKQLKSPDAREALTRIGTEGILKRLIGLLKDKDSYVRRAAAEALGEIGSESAVSALIQRLEEDKDSDVRRAAAYVLGDIGSEDAVSALIQRLEDKDSDVRRAAAYALGKIGSESAVSALIQRLENKDSYVRWAAAYALGKIGSESAVSALIQRLEEDKDSDVRSAAAYVLGDIGSEDAVSALIQRLEEDKDSDVRSAAAHALGRCSKRLKEDELVGLVKRLHEEGHNDAVEEIKKVQGRRFIRILHP